MALEDARMQLGVEYHYVICNYPTKPVGGPGCICHRLKLEEVLAELDEEVPGWDVWLSVFGVRTN